jgi:hypothetical protein
MMFRIVVIRTALRNTREEMAAMILNTSIGGVA